HQVAAANLYSAMDNVVRTKKLGRLFFAPTGVHLPNQPVPLQPDLFFLVSERLDIIGEKYIEGAPDLIVEILSPSDWLYDRREKMQVYEASGVREYWIVDYRAQTVEVYLLEERSYRLLGKWGQGEQAESHVIAGFSIPISEVFEL
ncbi:MAG: Uma2 family endonuclease, partial [Candidatus Binatia bacterium]